MYREGEIYGDTAQDLVYGVVDVTILDQDGVSAKRS